jgi:hypothetical protein
MFVLIIIPLCIIFCISKEYKKAKQLLTAIPLFQLSNKTLAVKSADNYRALRKRGITVRKTIDTIIATYCIEQLKFPSFYSKKH